VSQKIDVLGIGNAIVDVLVEKPDAFLESHGLPKGGMTLIDADRAIEIYQELEDPRQCSGGSAANTLVGVASLGGAATYVGKVRNDSLGALFRSDIREAGVIFETAAAESGPPTARCVIVVTPDAQRTMQTFLGISAELSVTDLDPEAIAAAKITYLEGYLWDPPAAKEAFLEAARIAHEAGRTVALTLSDPFCVERHRDEFHRLIEGPIDLLFANEDELLALYRTSDLDEAIRGLTQHDVVGAVTRGPKGSILLAGGDVHPVDAAPVGKVVDTTGAGDLYAAGVLFGHAQGLDWPQSGRLGSMAAGEIISHFGARPLESLAERARSIL